MNLHVSRVEVEKEVARRGERGTGSIGHSVLSYGPIVAKAEDALATKTLSAAVVAETLEIGLVEVVGVDVLLRRRHCYVLPLELLRNVLGIHITIHVRLPWRRYVPKK